MQNQPSFSMEDALKIASTPQGQAILSQLKQKHSQDLEFAIQQAQAGNYEQVKQTLSAFLSTDEGKKLMSQIRG